MFEDLRKTKPRCKRAGSLLSLRETPRQSPSTFWDFLPPSRPSESPCFHLFIRDTSSKGWQTSPDVLFTTPSIRPLSRMPLWSRTCKRFLQTSPPPRALISRRRGGGSTECGAFHRSSSLCVFTIGCLWPIYVCACIILEERLGPQREKFTACVLKMHASHTDTEFLLLEADCCAKAGIPYLQCLKKKKKIPHAFLQPHPN